MAYRSRKVVDNHDGLSEQLKEESSVTIASGGVEFENGGTSLNYYNENNTRTVQVSDSAGSPFYSVGGKNMSADCTRIGNIVSVTLTGNVTGTNASGTYARLVGIINADFRPSIDIFTTYNFSVGAVGTIGALVIRSASGDVEMYNGPLSAAFPGSGTVAFESTCFSYTR